jgi:hypothetical protein
MLEGTAPFRMKAVITEEGTVMQRTLLRKTPFAEIHSPEVLQRGVHVKGISQVASSFRAQGDVAEAVCTRHMFPAQDVIVNSSRPHAGSFVQDY